MVESALALELRQLIKSMGIAVPQLAERVGMDVARMSALLNGEEVKAEEVSIIEKAFESIRQQGVLVGKQREISDAAALAVRELVLPIFEEQLHPMYLVDVNFR